MPRVDLSVADDETPAQIARMKFKSILIILLVVPLFTASILWAQEDNIPTAAEESGVLRKTDAVFEGYTLFAPLMSNQTYLIDVDGRVVKMWDFDEATSQEPYLLENGNLLYQTNAESPVLELFGQAGGVAGGLREYTWDGELVWSYDYAGDTYQQHHDIEVLPNGNLLLIAWEIIDKEEALAAGMRPDRIPEGGDVWPDHIVEIDPQTNEIVWQWRVWDHLIQDTDPDLPNYGVVSEHPERIDINFADTQTLGDWQHSNSIDYNPELDQIVISVRNFSEIWIIDHSTTTEEAAGSTGGRSGMGGDLLYRWGNPAVYGAETADGRQLYYQHDAQWIKPGNPGAGNLLVFNNGGEETEHAYSSVLELVLPLREDGTYEREGSAYAPAEIVWKYVGDPPESLFAVYVSSAQRLANGNTLIAYGTHGLLLEVDPQGEVVWEYVNPFKGALEDNWYFRPTALFRAHRYAPDYPGLALLRAGEADG